MWFHEITFGELEFDPKVQSFTAVQAEIKIQFTNNVPQTEDYQIFYFTLFCFCVV